MTIEEIFNTLDNISYGGYNYESNEKNYGNIEKRDYRKHDVQEGLDLSKTKVGNCFDTAVYFYNMAKENGIDAKLYGFFDLESKKVFHFYCVYIIDGVYHLLEYSIKEIRGIYKAKTIEEIEKYIADCLFVEGKFVYKNILVPNIEDIELPISMDKFVDQLYDKIKISK